MNYIDIFQNHFKGVFPELFLIITVTTILLHATVCNASAKHRYPIMTTSIAWLAIQILFIALLSIANAPTWSVVLFAGELVIDDFAQGAKTIILLSALSSILISLDYIKSQRLNSFEYIILILFSTLSMLLIVSSYDLISMYLAIELQSLSFYVIAAFQRSPQCGQNEFSTEAGLKYFILGALSSGLLLFGESIVYGFTGITNFEELTKLFTFDTVAAHAGPLPFPEMDMLRQGTAMPLIIGLLFILAAFLFKISAVPFHMWAPDVYEGAPTSVTAFFAITPKIAVLSLLLRLCLYTFYDFIDSWQQVIIICSLLSMLIGTFGALNQKKIKRLFAYSSIAHVGYLLIGLATGTIEAIESLLLYIVIYILMIINVFGVLLALSPRNCYATLDPNPGQTWYRMTRVISGNAVQRHLKAGNPTWNMPAQDLTSSNGALRHVSIGALNKIGKKENFIGYITDLSSLSRTNPILAIALATIFFSNAGVPPLAGFYGKFNVFLAAVEGSMYLISIIAVICSVIGAFHSIRLVKIIYFHSMNRQNWTWYRTITKENSFVLGITFFFTLFFFVYPSFLSTLCHTAALSLCL